MRRRGAARLRLRAWPPPGALVGPPGLWPVGPVARAVAPRGLLWCARPWGPSSGALRAAAPPCALPSSGFGPPGCAGRPSAPQGSLRWPRAAAAPPAPGARLRVAPRRRPLRRSAPRAGGACGGGPRPLRGLGAGAWGRPWAAACSLWSPSAPLRPLPCAPAPGRGPLPLRPPSGARPFGPPGLLPPGGACGPAGRLFAPPRRASGCHIGAAPARLRPGRPGGGPCRAVPSAAAGWASPRKGA